MRWQVLLQPFKTVADAPFVMHQPKYAINLEPKFDFLQLIDVPSLIAAAKDQWYNQTLCRVNDCVVRLGVMQGEFHWHKQ